MTIGSKAAFGLAGRLPTGLHLASDPRQISTSSIIPIVYSANELEGIQPLFGSPAAEQTLPQEMFIANQVSPIFLPSAQIRQTLEAACDWCGCGVTLYQPHFVTWAPSGCLWIC